MYFWVIDIYFNIVKSDIKIWLTEPRNMDTIVQKQKL